MKQNELGKYAQKFGCLMGKYFISGKHILQAEVC